ncbi:MAG: hypothetical protein M3Q97_10235, partial [Bacteroidota bacterium]|nr:hypothetical protein [Bacteroidota bacterium]
MSPTTLVTVVVTSNLESTLSVTGLAPVTIKGTYRKSFQPAQSVIYVNMTSLEPGDKSITIYVNDREVAR